MFHTAIDELMKSHRTFLTPVCVTRRHCKFICLNGIFIAHTLHQKGELVG